MKRLLTISLAPVLAVLALAPLAHAERDRGRDGEDGWRGRNRGEVTVPEAPRPDFGRPRGEDRGQDLEGGPTLPPPGARTRTFEAPSPPPTRSYDTAGGLRPSGAPNDQPTRTWTDNGQRNGDPRRDFGRDHGREDWNRDGGRHEDGQRDSGNRAYGSRGEGHRDYGGRDDRDRRDRDQYDRDHDDRDRRDWGRNDWGRNDWGRNDWGRNDWSRNDWGHRDWNGRDNYRLRDRDHGRRWYDPQIYPSYYRVPYRFRAPPYRYPAGWFARDWRCGEFLPGGWYEPYYYLDWRPYGLAYPPVGCEWVRVGDSALLVDIYTGRILSIAYGVFY